MEPSVNETIADMQTTIDRMLELTNGRSPLTEEKLRALIGELNSDACDLHFYLQQLKLKLGL